VPEGEALHRTAAALRTALVGRAVLSFEAPRLDGPVPAAGRVIELVESHAWQLDMVWDDGLILHTNMLLGGVWHLYRTGERWRKPSSQLRVGISVDGFSAVCFGARTVETYREFDTHRHPGFGRPGPDLCAPEPDRAAAIEALCHYGDLDAPIAEALLDQQVASGIGNVFRSEILWACGQHPFAPVSMLGRDDMERIVNAAIRVLHAHLYPVPGEPEAQRAPLGVYGRNGQRCPRCGDTVEVRRLGEQARLLYWCPGCQVRRGPRPAQEPADQRPMDPHPAAAKFLSELPWRRREAG
jgi:endonuclease-8